MHVQIRCAKVHDIILIIIYTKYIYIMYVIHKISLNSEAIISFLSDI